MLLEDRLECYYFNKLFYSLKQVKMKVREHEYLKSTFILFIETSAFVLNSVKNFLILTLTQLLIICIGCI